MIEAFPDTLCELAQRLNKLLVKNVTLAKGFADTRQRGANRSVTLRQRCLQTGKWFGALVLSWGRWRHLGRTLSLPIVIVVIVIARGDINVAKINVAKIDVTKIDVT